MPYIIGYCCCGGCNLTLVYIRNSDRPSADAVTIPVYASTNPRCTGVGLDDDDQASTINDDLPNHSPRAYIRGPTGSGPATLISDLQTEFGASYVADDRDTSGFLKDLAPDGCACLGTTMSFADSSAVGDEYRMYYGETLIASGTLIDPSTCEDCPFFRFRSPCCGQTECGSGGDYQVITGIGAACLSGDPFATPPTTKVIQATGLVSVYDFADWSLQSISGSSFSGVTNTGIGFTVTKTGAGSMSLTWSAVPWWLVANFTAGEPLLKLSAGGTMSIVFDRPMIGAGFRVTQNDFTFRDDFFIHAKRNGSLITLSPSNAGDDLFVDSTVPSPNVAPFYGIAVPAGFGCFDEIVFGFAGSVNSGDPPPFAISTLEVISCMKVGG